MGGMLVVIILVVPCIMPLSWLILELGDGVSVELLGLQPTSANAARTVIAESAIIRFISVFSFLLFMFFAASMMAKAFRQPISSIRLWRDVVLRYGVFAPCEM